MPYKPPPQSFLKKLGKQEFANEGQLQRFVEDHLLEYWGLVRVCSSERPGERLGFVDTAALEASGAPTLFRYKHDLVDQGAVDQLARYHAWVEAHRAEFERAATKTRPGNFRWNSLNLVAIGYRFRLKNVAPIPHVAIALIRYGYRQDKTVSLEEVPWGDLDRGRAPLFSKDAALSRHLEKTTEAGRRAFLELRRRLDAVGLEEKIHGKNRVSYSKSSVLAELQFTEGGLLCLFKGPERLLDPDDRAKRLSRVASRPKPRFEWACGVTTINDVDAVCALVEQAAC